MLEFLENARIFRKCQTFQKMFKLLEFQENDRISRNCQNFQKLLELLEFLENWIKKTELKYTDLRAEGAKVGVFQFTPTFAPKARRPPAYTRPSSLSCVLDILCICTIYVSIRCIYQRLKIFLCFICFICFFVYAVSFVAMLHLHL